MAAVQCDKFGDAMFTQMFDVYAKSNTAVFINWCIEAVEKNSVSSKSKKDSFIRDIRTQKSKDRILTKVTNFFMAGEGLNVVKI